MKKGFTLIEVVISLVIASVIMSLSYTYYTQHKWMNSVNRMCQNIFYVLDKGVMDTVKGYINGTGGDCSDDHTYTDLSAARADDCAGFTSIYPYGGTKSTDGNESYMTKFLRNYTPNGDGCKLYLDDNNNSSDEFYMFLDCSNINYEGGSDRAKKYIEQKINSYMQINFSTIYQSVDFNATAIDKPTGGNDHDGKLRILFKK